MATGTQGHDFLINDTSVEFDVINGLGGDDTIRISPTDVGHAVVRIDGGSGFDTLTYNGSLWSLSPTLLVGGYGTLSPWNDFFYTGIERLIINVTAVSYPANEYGDSFPVYITTGDTIDEITVSSLRGADVIIHAGGGDDKIFLRDVGLLSEVWGGSGNDLIDLRSTSRGLKFFTALGEDGDDILIGSVWDDFMMGGAGDDHFYLGNSLTAIDNIFGQSGIDTLVLQGDYRTVRDSWGVVTPGIFLPDVNDIEVIKLLSGSDPASPGGWTSGATHYVLSTGDWTFAAGVQARIDGASLQAGESMTFDGSAETDARFLVLGGKGADRITGGQGDDIFFFGDDNRFAAGDSVDGGPGNDGLVLRGNYSLVLSASAFAGAIANVEYLTLSSASDTRFASGGTGFDYYIVWSDALLDAGQSFIIDGALLRSDETLIFQGSTERNGSFSIFGGAGNDILAGGRAADLIVGGGGGDRLVGNGGNDVYRYDRASDSTAAARDSIRDFNLGDRVDLSEIDASTLASGDQAFSFIGAAAFTFQAGELRIQSQGGPVWLVQGDTNGDGASDFELILTVVDYHPLTSGDFVL